MFNLFRNAAIIKLHSSEMTISQWWALWMWELQSMDPSAILSPSLAASSSPLISYTHAIPKW